MSEAQLYDALVVDTRPVIDIPNAPNNMVNELLVSMEMVEQEGGLASLCLKFDNTADHADVGLDFAFEYTETNVFEPGQIIRVLTGDAAHPQEIFRGTISAVELSMSTNGQPMLTVMAEDALMSWRMVRRSRTFKNRALRDIFSVLTENYTVTPVITGLDQTLPTQQQLNETDLGFMRRLLVRYDADAQIVGDELHISPRDQVDRGEVSLRFGSQLRSFRICADLAHQREQTSLSGFDIVSGSNEEVTSAAGTPGPGAGRTGPQLVADAYPGAVDRVVQTTFENRSEAQDIVDAMQSRRMRRFVLANGVATGNSGIRIGTRLTIDGVGPRFSNTYYTTRSAHCFDRSRGYTTHFCAESAYWGNV